MSGSNYERSLETCLHDAGMAVMRAPSSGGGTDRGTPTDYYFVDPDNARRTDGGGYGLPIGDILARSKWVVKHGDSRETAIVPNGVNAGEVDG